MSITPHSESMKKILYVDDEAINLKIFEINFKKCFAVVTSQSAEKGLDILLQDPEIKVVISDMKMPQMNGIEFIKKAKETRPELAYYILTGFEITPEIEEALQEKIIYEYFSKPLDPELIKNSLKKLFRCED